MGTPVSTTNKTDLHDITEPLLKVALNTINLSIINALIIKGIRTNCFISIVICITLIDRLTLGIKDGRLISIFSTLWYFWVWFKTLYISLTCLHVLIFQSKAWVRCYCNRIVEISSNVCGFFYLLERS